MITLVNGYGDYISELSLAAEGWTAEDATPGIPGHFEVRQDGAVVFCTWDHVENSSAYRIYRWDEGREAFVLAGETTDTSWLGPPPDFRGTTVNYFVTTVNEDGESLPSVLGTLVLDPYRKKDSGGGNDKGGRSYTGGFYSMNTAAFYRLERRYKDNFRKMTARYRNNFETTQNRYRRNFYKLMNGGKK
jgi:hypothetical protein